MGSPPGHVKSVDEAFAVHACPDGAITVTRGSRPVVLVALVALTSARLALPRSTPTVRSVAARAARFVGEVLDDGAVDRVSDEVGPDALGSEEERSVGLAVDDEADDDVGVASPSGAVVVASDDGATLGVVVAAVEDGDCARWTSLLSVVVAGVVEVLVVELTGAAVAIGEPITRTAAIAAAPAHAAVRRLPVISPPPHRHDAVGAATRPARPARPRQ